MSILDVACGTGLVGDALVKRGFSNITGLDFCKSMLDIANTKGDMPGIANYMKLGVYQLKPPRNTRAF